jgi:translation initiation factor IF-2
VCPNHVIRLSLCTYPAYLLYSGHILQLYAYFGRFSFTDMPSSKATQTNIVPRPPVVVIMGHIDHGKSTLLDYIRKTNVVATEAGGITQHLSAYVVEHPTKDAGKKKITFLDTPGHEAFQQMRFRGADVADIAILIVSAEDGVMPQTMEALECINKSGIPYIVAINKIDKPNANLVRTQSSLIEHGIYIEGMGGDISWVAISAKSGTGVDELLDMLLLTAELAEFTADTKATPVGKVIEGKLDVKRGNTATLMIKDGTLETGMFVVSGKSYAPVRIMEDWAGKTIKSAGPSEPVGIVGWTSVPKVGAPFTTVASKKEAEALTASFTESTTAENEYNSTLPVIPLLIKADVLGTIDAIKHELLKQQSERINVRIIGSAVGNVTSSDVQNVSATENAIIVGFNVKAERAAIDLAERLGVEIKTFDIIYKLGEWLETALDARTPKKEEERVTGKVKVLKHFSTQKHLHVLGGRLEEGTFSMNQHVRVLRRDLLLGQGVVKNLQQQKSNVQQITEGEFGMQLESKVEIAPGDYLEAFDIVVV